MTSYYISKKAELIDFPSFCKVMKKLENENFLGLKKLMGHEDKKADAKKNANGEEVDEQGNVKTPSGADEAQKGGSKDKNMEMERLKSLDRRTLSFIERKNLNAANRRMSSTR